MAAQKGPDPLEAQSFSTLRSQCSSYAVNAAAAGPIPISTRAISVHHIDSIQSLFCCKSNIRKIVLLNLAAWWRLASRAIGLPENPPVFVPIKKPPWYPVLQKFFSPPHLATQLLVHSGHSPTVDVSRSYLDITNLLFFSVNLRLSWIPSVATT